MISRSDLSGLVLAGGRATRMQTGPDSTIDKGLLLLNGKPLVAYACDHLRPHVCDVYISANRHADSYAAYGIVVPDDPAYGEAQGPLAGIASVLARVATPWLCILPVDSPLLPPNIVPRLAQAVHADGGDIAYAATDRSHPLCMLMRASCLPALRSYLLGGGRRVHEWIGTQRSVEAKFCNPDDRLVNVNSPADLARAQTLASWSGGSGSGEPQA